MVDCKYINADWVWCIIDDDKEQVYETFGVMGFFNFNFLILK